MIYITYKPAKNDAYYSHQPTGGVYGKQKSSRIAALVKTVRQAPVMAMGAYLYHFRRNRVRLHLLFL